MNIISGKTIIVGLVAALCSATAALAQSSSPTPAPSQGASSGGGTSLNQGEAGKLEQKLQSMTPEERETFMQNHPKIREWFHHHRDEMLARYSQMSPAQQQQFLQEHPQFQQFVQNHPEAVTKAAANAKEAGPGVSDPNHPRVNEVNNREENQQQRIAQGETNGTISSSQASNLDKRESNLQSRETADMDQHDGHLTRGEKHRLNRQENRLSHNIYEDKH